MWPTVLYANLCIRSIAHRPFKGEMQPRQHEKTLTRRKLDGQSDVWVSLNKAISPFPMPRHRKHHQKPACLIVTPPSTSTIHARYGTHRTSPSIKQHQHLPLTLHFPQTPPSSQFGTERCFVVVAGCALIGNVSHNSSLGNFRRAGGPRGNGMIDTTAGRFRRDARGNHNKICKHG